MRKQPVITLLVALTAALAAMGAADRIAAEHGGGKRTANAKLTGWNEVPSVSSSGRGDFKARIDNDDETISYELEYSRLEGTTTMFAHIHVGQPGVNGGVSVFLCGGGGKPACPAVAGEVTGTITAADVAGPAAQGVAAGEIDELIDAIRNKAAYANVHTDKFPNGEIRGQLH